MKRQDRESAAPLLASRLHPLKWGAARTLFVVIALVFGTASCARTPEKPPESALKHAKKDSPPAEPEETDLERRHLAPPPAYGNKVVMAEDGRTEIQRF